MGGGGIHCITCGVDACSMILQLYGIPLLVKDNTAIANVSCQCYPGIHVITACFIFCAPCKRDNVSKTIGKTEIMQQKVTNVNDTWHEGFHHAS